MRVMSEHASAPTAWPPHGSETLTWRQQVRGGTRADRMLTSVEASIPPLIAELEFLSLIHI